MKKSICTLLLVMLVCTALTGCNNPNKNANAENGDISAIGSESEGAVSDEKSESETDESDEISIVDIVCNFEGKYYASALETIYMDETYIYTLSSYCSQDIIVTYSDGTTQNVKEAIDDGNVTLADLDRFEIKYSKRVKLTGDHAG